MIEVPNLKQRLRRITLTSIAIITIGIIHCTRVDSANAEGKRAASSLRIERIERTDRSAKTLLEGCPFRIEFGSYAAGIDNLTFSKILRWLLHDHAVSKILLIPWGREGELTLCVEDLDKNTGTRLFQAIRTMIPEQSKRGWTSVSYGQQTHKTKWPN